MPGAVAAEDGPVDELSPATSPRTPSPATINAPPINIFRACPITLTAHLTETACSLSE
jgi:hypothetical protein